LLLCNDRLTRGITFSLPKLGFLPLGLLQLHGGDFYNVSFSDEGVMMVLHRGIASSMACIFYKLHGRRRVWLESSFLALHWRNPWRVHGFVGANNVENGEW